MRKKFAAILSVLLITGCTATPDLSGWAQNSAEMAGAVSYEHQKVIDRVDGIITHVRVGEKEKWRLLAHTSEGWVRKRDGFKTHADAIRGTLDFMVLYANAIANLAASGETGADAAKKIGGSVKQIVELVGKSYPLTAAATSFFEQIAEIVTTVQTQDSLADGMSVMQPKVDALAKFLIRSVDAQKLIVGQIYAAEQRLLREAAGPQAMKAFLNQDVRGSVEGAIAGGTPISGSSGSIADAHAVSIRYRDLVQNLAEAQQWNRKRHAALDAVKTAVDLWRKAHDEARTVLVNCGGFRSLKFSCGNYTAANLKLAAEKIKSVLPDDAPSAATP